MIDLDYIRTFFPESIRTNNVFSKMMLKEYIQLMILDFISTTDYAQKLVFIGGTNLRIIHGIDRFSEDLDFDCKQITNNDFMEMTDDVLHFLRRNGFNAETKDSESSRLTAFRRSFYFPQLLFDLNLTGHKDERFLIKLEAQDQDVNYTPKVVTVNKCGFVFPQQVPPDSVLCAMKISALLSRHKGRDFYDTMFLLSKTEPDYDFLNLKTGIKSKSEMKSALTALIEAVDINHKMHDFEHLLFNSKKINSILMFGDFIKNM